MRILPDMTIPPLFFLGNWNRVGIDVKGLARRSIERINSPA
jgi:hypothetical protein